MTENDSQPIPRKTPKKKGSGPSMREQILARRREEAQSGASGAAPAPAKKAPSTRKPAKKPVEIKVADSSRPGGKTRASSRTSARRAGGASSRRSTDDQDEDAPRAGGRGRRERPVKKKSPIPLIAAGLIVVGGGIGGFFALTGGETEASETDPAGTKDTTTAGANEAEGDGMADGSTDPAATGDVADETTGAEDAAEATDAVEAAAKPKPEEETKDVDLSTLEPFGMPLGATEEEWMKLQEDAELFFDIDAGAAGTRAQRRMEEAGKNAWPAILNQMIKLDPGNPDDNQLGMLGQRALNAARGSETAMAFDWRTPDDGVLSEKNLRYNKKLIKALYDSWAKVVEDPKHWDRLNKAEEQQEAKEREKAKIDDDFDFDPGDLDDLDG